MAESEVIVHRSRRTGGCFMIAFGTIFGGFGAVFAVVAINATFDSPNPVTPFLSVLGGFFALIGAAIVIAGVRSVWLRHVLGAATLTLPPTQPLLLGSAVTARFERTGGARRTRGVAQLSAELTCQESVTYRQGTDDHTVTRELRRHQLGVTGDQVPGTVSGQVVIQIPPDAPPSLRLSHNRIIWAVLVHVQAPGVPDDTASFVVTVPPVVAGRRPGTPR